MVTFEDTIEILFTRSNTKFQIVFFNFLPSKGCDCTSADRFILRHCFFLPFNYELSAVSTVDELGLHYITS